MGEKRDNIEVRLNKDGTLDEIVVYNPHTDECLFHLEQMDEHYYWMRAYGITQDLVAHIGATISERNGLPLVDEKNKFIGYEKTLLPKVESNYEWEDAITEGDCDKKFQRPPVEKRVQISDVIKKYGVACVLQEITDILRQGRNEQHDQILVSDLDNARTNFLLEDKAYWDALMSAHKTDV